MQPIRKIYLALVICVLTLVGCKGQELSKAEDDLMYLYSKLDAKIQSRDITLSVSKELYQKSSGLIAQQQRASAEREFHQVAKSGALGTTEALRAAKKEMAGGTAATVGGDRYESDRTYRLWVDASNELKQQNADLKTQLPAMKNALAAYYGAVQRESAKEGKQPIRSSSLDGVIRSMEKEIKYLENGF